MPAIPLDPDGMHQVVHNVLLNAIDAAPQETGRVNIRTSYRPQDQEVIVSIADNGQGIPEAQRAKIFDAFHSSKGQAGTGLGLAAAKKIISELQGSIEVDSTIGQGSVFRIKLPTTQAEGDPTRPLDSP
jgi:signal transduction histidine kinase